MYGYHRKLLHVDLSRGSSWVEETTDDFMRTYAGGGLLATYLLLRETVAGNDPLGPENLLIFASSIVGGHRGPGLAMHTVAAKSPLTNGIGEARTQGPWGSALKASGVDAVIVHGRADSPTTVVVDGGQATLHDASHLWGRTVGSTTDALIQQFASDAVATIGPAGENLVRYASIISNRTFAAARMGMGAVMGSKNLKAVVVKGDATPPVANQSLLDELARWYASNMHGNDVCLTQLHPPGFAWWPIEFVNWRMSQAVDNYRRSDLPAPDSYAPDAALPFVDGLAPCPGCPNDCVKTFHGPGMEDLDSRAGGMLQEITGSFGPNIGTTDVHYIVRANNLCNQWGLDPASLGATIAFTMECVEEGVLHESDIDLALHFGNTEAALEMTRRIAFREGFGDVIAEGVRRSADVVGKEANRFALHVKGLEIPPFDPRSQTNLGLGYAVSPTGPRHDICEHDNDWDPDLEAGYGHSIHSARTLGILEPIPMHSYGRGKVRNYKVLNNFFSAGDALNFCVFSVDPSRLLTPSRMATMVEAITGWECSSYEVMRWGERRNHLMRVYNNREGMTPLDDDLPARFYDEPVTWGRHKGLSFDRETFRDAIDFYYAMMGWDPEGRPLQATLYDHQLEWVWGGPFESDLTS